MATIGMKTQQRAAAAAAATSERDPFLTLERVYLAAVVILTTAAALQVIVRPHDFWWHLANGRTIIVSSVFPTIDTFTYTRGGEPFFNQMWLAQVVMYLLHRVGDVALVVAAHGALIGLAYAGLLQMCTRLTGRPRLCALVFLMAVVPLSFTNWAVRPQPYAFPIFVTFLALLVYDRGQTRAGAKASSVWLLPPLMVLWVNLHGSYVLGLVLVTIVAGTGLLTRAYADNKQDVTRLAAVAAATWAASLLNPRGFDVLSYAASMMTNASVALASEWRPVSVGDFMGVLYFAFSGCVILLMIYAPRRPRPLEAVVVVLFMLLGFTAVRHTIWFALAAAPLVCLQASSMMRPPPMRRDPGIPLLNGVLLAVFASALILSLPWVRQTLQLPVGSELTSATPAAATRYLNTIPDRPERIFNDLGYGSYLAWALPDQKTFIDPRFELFPVEQVEDYRSLSSGRDVEALTEKYDFDAFLISRESQSNLVARLKAWRAWRLAYEDDEALLFLPTR